MYEYGGPPGSEADARRQRVPLEDNPPRVVPDAPQDAPPGIHLYTYIYL